MDLTCEKSLMLWDSVQLYIRSDEYVKIKYSGKIFEGSKVFIS